MSTGSLWLIWICCFSGLYKSAICKRFPKIAGGQNACIKEFPSMAALILKEDDIHNCGGSIISKKYIITAAHCFESCSEPGICTPLEKDDYYVRVGSTKYKYGKKYDIEDIFSHPKYKTLIPKNDIALIKIKGKFKFTDKIKAIPIAPKSKVPDAGAKVTLVGWGKTTFDSNDSHATLKKTEHNIFDHEKCKKYYDDLITSKQICTYSKTKNTGVCYGDSGGPVVYKGKLIGIVSLMIHHDCFSKKAPHIHTKVISYKKWIQKYLKV